MKKASKEVIEKMKKLLKAGKVEWAIPEKCDAPITVGEFTFTAVNISESWNNKHGIGFRLSWGVENCGFGTTDFHQSKDGTITADDECMRRDFVAALLTALLVRTTLSSETMEKIVQ